ncbi:hypothetical protein GCM10007857_86370 [Bradyrhizobium iriomotense]|uniref:Uncharacterized protein n=1 Tax=Bradyrhizobium iriomotense TaxID=441950 RepID=A0ABQ6BBW2_9BRAD|nr:hypothetical protein GCM10007857_86370 [Bradyrhizobium iriomotense]
MVTTTHAKAFEPRCQPGGCYAKCPARVSIPAAVPVASRQDPLFWAAGEEALGVVQTKVWEKACGFAGIAHADWIDSSLPRQVAPFQKEAPEAAELPHRETVHRCMIGQFLTNACLTPSGEVSQLRMRERPIVGTEHHFVERHDESSSHLERPLL